MKKSFDLQRIAPAVLVVLAALASPASAQPVPQKVAAAQSLFDDAMALISGGNPAAACPKLEAAQRLDPGMATQFRLAECYEKIGRTASAWALFVEVAEAARVAHSTERAAVARQRATALEPRLAKVSVRVADAAAALPGLQIQRDGIEVDRGLWGAAVAVDPGEHIVVATAPGKQRWEGKGTTGPSSPRLDITVPMLEEPLKSEPIAASTIATPSRSELPSNRRSLVPAFVVGGVGVVGVGVGAALLALSAGALADAKTNSTVLRANGGSCNPAFSNYAGQSPCAALDATLTKVDTLHNAGLIPLVVGGAAVGGALLYALWPASGASAASGVKHAAPSARIAPIMGHGEGGVLLSGSF
ncbi:MAG: hypothetical protein ABJE95_00140 [Byssovorax sp.]